MFIAACRTCRIRLTKQLLLGRRFMRNIRLLTLSLSSSLLFSVSAMAGKAITIEPGMWEMTSKMTSPMSPQPRVQTVNECMTDSEIDPQDLIPEDGGDCTVTSSDVSGNSMTWALTCNTPGGAMTGNGSFTSKGSSGHGNMKMNMSIEGQSFNMEVSWEGKRIGSC